METHQSRRRARFSVPDLRHKFIINYAEINTPLAVVQAQARHLLKRMTELYTHISQRTLDKAVEQYSQRKAETMAAAKEKLKAEQAKSATETVNLIRVSLAWFRTKSRTRRLTALRQIL